MATSPSSQLGQRVQRGIPVAAALGQVLAGHHAQPGRNHLQEHGHQAGQADDPQQPVLELGAALQVGAPVAGVHVADAHQHGRPDERPHLPPEAGLMVGQWHGAVHPFQRHLAGRRVPVLCAYGFVGAHRRRSPVNQTILPHDPHRLLAGVKRRVQLDAHPHRPWAAACRWNRSTGSTSSSTARWRRPT